MNRKLMFQDEQGNIVTTTRAIADMLKDGKNKKRDDDIHRNILKVLETLLKQDELLKNIVLNKPLIDGNHVYTKTMYKYGRSRYAKMYTLNFNATLYLFMHLSNYNKIRKVLKHLSQTIPTNMISLFDMLEVTIRQSTEYDSRKHVYIILCKDDTIKVGVSINTEKRLKSISNQSGKQIVKSFSSDLIEDGFKIEKRVLNYFDDFRIDGEWLKGVAYDTVLKYATDCLN